MLSSIVHTLQISYICFMMTSIFKIIGSEFKIDFKNLGSWLGIILFLVASSYISFILFDDIRPETWLAILWLIILFSALQSFYTTFKRELVYKPLYFYTLYSAHEALIAKVLYQSIRLIALSVMAVILLRLFHGYPITQFIAFWSSIIFGSIGMSSIFTLTSAMSNRSDQSSALLAVISFPLIIPFLLGVINLSFKSIMTEIADLSGDIGLVAALILVVLSISIFLFPLIWRD